MGREIECRDQAGFVMEKSAFSKSRFFIRSFSLLLIWAALSSCITWLGGDRIPADTEFRGRQVAKELTISFNYKNVDYSQMDASIQGQYMANFEDWLRPGMDAVKATGLFESVRFVGMDIPEKGHHLQIVQDEDSGAWTIVNAVIMGLTLNWIPTYVCPDHVFQVNHYRDGQKAQTLDYRITYNSVNWNLFFPFAIADSNPSANQRLYINVMLNAVQDLY